MTKPTLTENERDELDRIERARGMARTNDQRARAGDRAIALQRKVDGREQSEWLANALGECDRLAELRDEDIIKPIGAMGRRERRTTLRRLFDGGLITEEEHAAGKWYGETWQRLYERGLFRSNLDDRSGGGGGGDLDPLDARVLDIQRLSAARGYDEDESGRQIKSGLLGDARMIQLCDDICGRDMTLKQAIGGDTRKRRRFRAKLKAALGLLALHRGILKVRDQDQRAA